MCKWQLRAGGAALVLSSAVLAGAGAPNVTFTDVTRAAGLEAPQWDGAMPHGTPIMEMMMYMMSAAAAAGDFDGDGWTDLYICRLGMPNLLMKNMGDGTFVDVAAEAGVAYVGASSSAAWADIDNDGDLDLYVLDFWFTHRNQLYINEGNGRFTEQAVARGLALPSECVDCNGDTRRFAGVAFGDYDNDGHLDLFTSEWSRNMLYSKNRLFRNDGTGHFTNVTQAAGVWMPTTWGFAPRFSDYDQDGHPDLLIAADFGTSKLFRNLGNGRFEDITVWAGVGTDENGMGSALGDFDGDGRLDWFVTSIWDPFHSCKIYDCGWAGSGNRLYRNRGDGRFDDVTDWAGVRDGGWGWGAAFFDFDNDTHLDLGMTNGVIFPGTPADDPFNDDPVRLWHNDGTGRMREVSKLVGMTDTRSGKGWVCFDYDRDGDVDVLILNNMDGPLLYRNDGGNRNPWLQVDLRGRASNRYGIGARVTVQLDNRTHPMVREVSSGTNYMGQDETTLHYGLGAGVNTIGFVRVEWPTTGHVQVLRGITPNVRLTIEEPE